MELSTYCRKEKTNKMQKCSKCGKELPEGSKFCDECGTKLEAVKETTSAEKENKEAVEEKPAKEQEQEVTEEKKATVAEETVSAEQTGEAQSKPIQSEAVSNKKTGKGLIIGGIVVAVALAGSVIYGITQSVSPTIKLADFTTVEVEGYDGYGKATVTLDWEALESKYGKKMQFTDEYSKKMSEYGFEITPAEWLSSAYAYKADVTSDLSNDDIITVSYKAEGVLENVLKCKIDDSALVYTVSGLEEVETYDAFEKLDVEFSGVSSKGLVSYNYTGDEDLQFTDDTGISSFYTYGDLSNGDEVTISINISDANAFVAKYGHLPAEMSKTYTVTGLSEYCTEIADISDDAKATLKSQAEDTLKAYLSSNTESYTMTEVGDYFESKKTSSNVNYGENGYAIVYKVDYLRNEYSKETETVYIGEIFKNLTYTEDGTSNASELQCNSIGGVGWTTYNTVSDYKKNAVDVDSANYTIEWNVSE